MMKKQVIIAIDGLSSSGKSTLAKQLAKALHYEYIDSGAFYRAVTYFILHGNIDAKNEFVIIHSLENVHLSFYFDFENGHCQTFLNGKDIESEIRTLEVSKAASEVSAIAAVRDFVTKELRNLSLNKN